MMKFLRADPQVGSGLTRVHPGWKTTEAGTLLGSKLVKDMQFKLLAVQTYGLTMNYCRPEVKIISVLWHNGRGQRWRGGGVGGSWAERWSEDWEGAWSLSFWHPNDHERNCFKLFHVILDSSLFMQKTSFLPWRSVTVQHRALCLVQFCLVQSSFHSGKLSGTTAHVAMLMILWHTYLLNQHIFSSSWKGFQYVFKI